MTTNMFTFTFPALRGIQSGNEYYVSVCPLGVVARYFVFDEENLPPEMRVQRVLNKGRIPAIAEYMIQNPTQYVFSAITVSIDADVKFTPITSEITDYSLGWLKIPMDARFIINDGQHRRAAIEVAIKERPALASETIATVFFVDRGLARSQQMFADLNRYTIRPTQSLSILYDHRDPLAKMARDLSQTVDIFVGMTEMDKSTISNRSNKLFTLSSIHRATIELLKNRQDLSLEAQGQLAAAFWDAVAAHMPEWRAAKVGGIAPAALRRDYIHVHAVTLAAIGRAGNTLLSIHPHDWPERLVLLERLDWRRNNAEQWEGRVTIGGQISASSANQVLLTNAIKVALDLPLTSEEADAEVAHNAHRSSNL